MSEETGSLGITLASAPAGRRGFLGRLVGAIAGGLLLAKIGSAFGQEKSSGRPAASQAGANGPLAALDGDPWLGEIALVPFNFAPVGWAFCNGQLLSIAQNAALFSLIGTTYGGNGTSNFALPNLQGRAPIHMGQGAGLTGRVIGESGGEETHTLSLAEIPAHRHSLMCDSTVGSSDSPANATPAKNAAGIPQYSTNPGTTMNAAAVGIAGGGSGHNNMPPFLVMNYIIALSGIFPSRS